MPLHDVGYRPWRGPAPGPGHASWVIAGTGLRLAWKSRWLRRAVLFAWSPALAFAVAFFAFEQAVDEGRLSGRAPATLGDAPGMGMVGAVLADALGGPQADVDRTRRLVWSRLLLAFMRAPQALLLALVVGLVAPPLISADLRARAWLVYFTRPLRRIDYVLGKAAVLAALVALVTVVPALALWVAGVLVSPSLWMAVATWDLPLRIVAAGVLLTVPTVLVALAFSALTAESRIATFAWFATWAACWIAHGALTGADLAAGGAAAAAVIDVPGLEDAFGDEDATPLHQPHSLPPRRLRWLWRAAGLDRGVVDRWAWLSPYHALGVAQAWVFGVERRREAVVPPLLSLAAVSALAFVVLLRRVDAPARA